MFSKMFLRRVADTEILLNPCQRPDHASGCARSLQCTGRLGDETSPGNTQLHERCGDLVVLLTCDPRPMEVAALRARVPASRAQSRTESLELRGGRGLTTRTAMSHVASLSGRAVTVSTGFSIHRCI